MKITADDLHVRRGVRGVLADVALSVGPGELLVVAGANGAGKSTLLKTLAGLLPPSRGTVHIDGRAVTAWDRAELGRRIAYLPQERRVHWPLSVRATVALGRLPHGGTIDLSLSAGHREVVERVLADMNLALLADRAVSTLSGGELARTLLARALAQEPTILIADEPAAGLDPAYQLALMDRLVRLAESGASVITASHDLSHAARYATRVVLLKAGRIIADGEPGEVLHATALRDAFGIEARIGRVEGLPVVVPIGPAA